MKFQKLLAYTLKGILSPLGFLPHSWKPIPLCSWYGKLGINTPPLVGHATAPTLSTGAASPITGDSALIPCSITSTGGENPSERGVCYSTTNSTPTTADSVISETGSFSTGNYTEYITGLPSGTIVYYRAYAINSGGTGYGSATGSATTTAPLITTGTAGSITSTTATISGNNITSTNGTNATERGVCYSTTNTFPTVSDSKVSNTGSFGTGTFSINLSGLPTGTLVYFNAYAININGTGYGTPSSFTPTSGGGSVKSGFFQLM